MRIITTVILFLGLSISVGAQSKGSAPAPIVFFDIAGPNAAQLQSFYAELFGWNTNSKEPTIPVTSPIPMTIRQDPAEKRVYIGVADVARKLEEIKARGGTVDSPRFEVPGVAVIGLFKDPAGNPMGLIEMVNGKAKIP